MSQAPERIHVRWGKSGDTRVTYMEERFMPPDNGADYIRADAPEVEALRAERDALQKCALHGMDMTNHHNAAMCPYCSAEATAKRDALTERVRAAEAERDAAIANRNEWCDVANRAAAILKRVEDSRMAAQDKVVRLTEALTKIGSPASVTARKLDDHEYLASEWQKRACDLAKIARDAIADMERTDAD